jgi:DNA-3-methyladenine glycosylase I
VPVHDDRILFEFLILEGAQAGLSWITILKKREAFRAAFAGFGRAKVAQLLADHGTPAGGFLSADSLLVMNVTTFVV